MKYKEHYLKALEVKWNELKEQFDSETSYLLNIIDTNIKNFEILEVGCGNGRALKKIFKKIKKSDMYLTGIDIDKSIIDLAKLENPKEIDFFHMDALNLKFNRQFDLTFTTYNTLGGYSTDLKEGITPKKRQKFINEMVKVTKDKGKIINITWNNDDFTTEFLKKYYSDIDFSIKLLTDGKSILLNKEREFIFERIYPEKIVKLYRKAGIRYMYVRPLGKLWTAIEGYKN